MDDVPVSKLLYLTALITSAHLTRTPVSTEEMDGLIRSVYGSLAGVDRQPPQTEKPQPAVPIKKSVFPDYIVCLEDGKRLAMLKRHLATAYGLTPDEYRRRWGLPRDYPMVAPSYTERRSALARESGLGRRDAAAEESSAPPILRVPEGLSGKRAARKAKTAGAVGRLEAS